LIAIIDYGMGNLRSVQKALEKLGYEAEISGDKQVIAGASGVILPGVGAFKDAMENLKEAGLVETIKEVEAQNKPFLGICLGLQLLFTKSEENGLHQGLDILPGRVIRFKGDKKVPHMGWNQAEIVNQSPILKGIPSQSFFYFVHSYYVVPDDEKVIAAETEYGERFTSVAARNNLFGIQFHPEKSSKLGLKILNNFGELVSSVDNPGH